MRYDVWFRFRNPSSLGTREGGLSSRYTSAIRQSLRGVSENFPVAACPKFAIVCWFSGVRTAEAQPDTNKSDPLFNISKSGLRIAISRLREQDAVKVKTHGHAMVLIMVTHCNSLSVPFSPITALCFLNGTRLECEFNDDKERITEGRTDGEIYIILLLSVQNYCWERNSFLNYKHSFLMRYPELEIDGIFAELKYVLRKENVCLKGCVIPASGRRSGIHVTF